MEMMTIKEIDNNWNNIECNSCGKSRRKYYEIRYGIPVSGQPWQPYATLPLCVSCLRKLGNSIEKKLTKLKMDGQ